MVAHRPFPPSADSPQAKEAKFLKDFWIYVLKSERDGIYYVGSTQDVEKRLVRHNLGEYRFTKAHRPWKAIHQERVSSRPEAVIRERFLKSGVGRQELEEMLASYR